MNFHSFIGTSFCAIFSFCYNRFYVMLRSFWTSSALFWCYICYFSLLEFCLLMELGKLIPLDFAFINTGLKIVGLSAWELPSDDLGLLLLKLNFSSILSKEFFLSRGPLLKRLLPKLVVLVTLAALRLASKGWHYLAYFYFDSNLMRGKIWFSLFA